MDFRRVQQQQQASEVLKLKASWREPTVQISLIQDLWLDDFFNNILQGDDTQNLIERVSLTLIVHPLNYGQVGFS